MRHLGILSVALILESVACADGSNLDDGTGAGSTSTGEWSGGGPTTGSTSSGSDGGGGAAGTTVSTGSTGSSSTGGEGGATTSSTGGGGTGGGDVSPPTVDGVTPADGAMAVLSSSKIEVTFSEPMDPASVTASANASCSGSVQVSSDGFSSCVPIAGGATTLDDVTFTLTPSAPLGSLKQYKVRVTTSATDAAGNALVQAFETANGFSSAFRHTVVVDGINDFFPMSDAIATSTAGTQLYVTHDETDLFVGLSSPDIAPAGAGNKFVYFLFSTDAALAAGNTLSSDGKAKFGTGKAMTYHYKERIAGGTYTEYRIGNASGWTTDWGTQNKTSFVASGFLEARIALAELGGASPSSVAVTAYTVDYAGDSNNGWLYNMISGATDGSGVTPRDLVQYVGLDLPGPVAPNDAGHIKSF